VAQPTTNLGSSKRLIDPAPRKVSSAENYLRANAVVLVVLWIDTHLLKQSRPAPVNDFRRRSGRVSLCISFMLIIEMFGAVGNSARLRSTKV
jgi:hypothetical protein